MTVSLELVRSMSEGKFYESEEIRRQNLKSCSLVIAPVPVEESLNESKPGELKCTQIFLETELDIKILVEVDKIGQSEAELQISKIERLPSNYPLKMYTNIPNLSIGNILDKAQEIAKGLYNDEEFKNVIDYRIIRKIHQKFADQLIEYITKMDNEASKLIGKPAKAEDPDRKSKWNLLCEA